MTIASSTIRIRSLPDIDATRLPRLPLDGDATGELEALRAGIFFARAADGEKATGGRANSPRGTSHRT